MASVPPAPMPMSMPPPRANAVAEDPALSFQVYSPDELRDARPLARSPSTPRLASKMSLGAKICIFLVGLCIVVGTASAIIAVSTDDAPKKTSKPGPVLVSTGTVPIAEPAPPPSSAPAAAASSIVIDPDPSPAAASAGAGGTTSTTSTAAPAAASAKKGGKPGAPPAVKGVAPPPNPYAAPSAGKSKKGLSASNPF